MGFKFEDPLCPWGQADVSMQMSLVPLDSAVWRNICVGTIFP